MKIFTGTILVAIVVSLLNSVESRPSNRESENNNNILPDFAQYEVLPLTRRMELKYAEYRRPGGTICFFYGSSPPREPGQLRPRGQTGLQGQPGLQSQPGPQGEPRRLQSPPRHP